MKNADKPINPFINDDGYATTEENIDHSRELIGLTKREYFAGLAMQGLLNKIDPNMYNDIVLLDFGKRISQVSCFLADELLQELEKATQS